MATAISIALTLQACVKAVPDLEAVGERAELTPRTFELVTERLEAHPACAAPIRPGPGDSPATSASADPTGDEEVDPHTHPQGCKREDEHRPQRFVEHGRAHFDTGPIRTTAHR